MDACGFLRVGLFECGEALAEACGVLVGDGEDTDAALRAAGFADEMLTTTAVGVGYCGIYDLDEGGSGRHVSDLWRRRDRTGVAN